MPSITLGIFDHVVFLVLVALLPWNGRRRFHSLVKAVDAGDPNARTRAYRTVLIEKWVLTAVIAVAWIALSRSASSIGLIAELTPLAIVGFALTALAIGALLVLTRSVARSEQGRSKARKALAPVRALLPHTATEKRWFDAVSVTAGICEEFIYRGFLFAYLAAWLPGMPVGVVVVLAGLVFGLGHLYQGAGRDREDRHAGSPVRRPLLDDRFGVGADAPARRRRSEQRLDQLAGRTRRWPRRPGRAGRGVAVQRRMWRAAVIEVIRDRVDAL